ncbi:ANTAR domain-containing response regulator [Rhodobacter lacus]|uniref:ANTAR domain-containing response regulator n=1 Tax=Rhodobacter lacus TaxID=1641972 RepID=A0ABW5A5Z6_9RHOB
MSYAFLKELRDLSVVVLHPMDEEGIALTDHLRRIGCSPQLIWPVPEKLPERTDILLVSIDGHHREPLRRFLRAIPNPGPTILAIVSYEDPATLQLVLESGAMAVLGRPIKPFGLLTNLAIARNAWKRMQDLARDARRFKRKVMGDQMVSRAKTILMAEQNLREDEAHRELRARAMQQRVAIEVLARDFVAAHEAANESHSTETIAPDPASAYEIGEVVKAGKNSPPRPEKPLSARKLSR